MPRAPKRLYALYADGEVWGVYATPQEAHDDAWGPIFRTGYSVREYQLVPRKHEHLPCRRGLQGEP